MVFDTVLGALQKLRKRDYRLYHACLSQWPLAYESAPTERIFMKFGIWIFLENMPKKFMFH
jgi:hypothetical protein